MPAWCLFSLEMKPVTRLCLLHDGSKSGDDDNDEKEEEEDELPVPVWNLVDK